MILFVLLLFVFAAGFVAGIGVVCIAKMMED